MVHRPPDSRLLSTLLSKEKDYSKQLDTLLDASNASLNSVVAYASASPPAHSSLLLNIVEFLARIDDATRNQYARGVEEWRRSMEELKELEEQVARVVRDREILVTRLIKAASKSANNASSNREALMSPIPTSTYQPRSPSASSLNLSEDSMSITSAGSYHPQTTSKKLAMAQSELQACEAHLAQKEKELEMKRSTAVTQGMSYRVRALVDTGKVWADIGGQLMTLLQQHSSITSPTLDTSKPLPDLGPSSDLSSISPSESASQIGSPRINDIHGLMYSPAPDFVLDVPPAHAIAETGIGIPRGAEKQPALPRRITEEDEQEEDGSSDDEDLPIATTLVENTNMKLRGNGNGKEKKAGGSGFFGSIRGLFSRKASSSVAGDDDVSHTYSAPAARAPVPSWDKTRTDKNVRKLGKGSPLSASVQDLSEGDRGRRRRNTVDLNSPEKRQRRRSASLDAGLDAGTGTGAGAGADGKLRKPSTKKKRARTASLQQTTPTPSTHAGVSRNASVTSGPSTQRGAQLSRNTSITSATSLPPSFTPAAGGHRKRRSVDETRKPTVEYQTSPVLKATTSTTAASKAERRASSPPAASASGQSLMSIVESVSKGNRAGWVEPSVEVTPIPIVKAPAKVSRRELEEQIDIQRSSPPSKAANRMSSPGPSERKTASALSDHATTSSSSMSMPKAPGSIFDSNGSLSTPPSSASSPAIVLHQPMPRSPATAAPVVAESDLSSGSGAKTSSQTRATLSPPPRNAMSPRPDKSPLKSAMRNGGSRSPSPSPLTMPLPLPVIEIPAPAPAPVPRVTASPAPPADESEDEDDGASISSYKTVDGGDEDDDDVEEDATHAESEVSTSSNATIQRATPPPPTPPPAVPPLPPPKALPQPQGITPSTSNSTVAPARRKSVRVSLKPTFSPTPPAIEYDDVSWSENGSAVEGSGSGVKDVWEDSSDDDEEYERARKLLNRAKSR